MPSSKRNQIFCILLLNSTVSSDKKQILTTKTIQVSKLNNIQNINFRGCQKHYQNYNQKYDSYRNRNRMALRGSKHQRFEIVYFQHFTGAINKISYLLITKMLKSQQILLECTSNKESEKHTSQSSEFSEKSITKFIENRLKNQHAVSRREIEQMNQRVKNQLMRNRINYQKLIAMNPYFSMKLFTPINNFTTLQYNRSSLNLMMNQLDSLLQDGHLLEKEIKKTELRKMQSDYMNNYQLDNSKHHYAYIRKIWLNSNDADAKNPMERIQQLNKKVVLIKNNLYSLTDIQKKAYERNLTNYSNDYQSVLYKINEVVQQTKEYSLLKQKYESLKMSYEQLYNKFVQLKSNNAQIQLEKNEAVKKLKQENDDCRKMLKQSKEKQLNIEMRQAQLLLKIKQLQTGLKQKKTERSQVPATLNSLKNDFSKNRIIVNMEDIKFRKFDLKQVVIAEKQRQMQMQTEKKNTEVETLETQPSQPKAQVSEFSPAKEQTENVNKMNDRSFNFRDQKSPDGKKGRFTRMRSPVGGKLMKNKGSEQQDIKKGQFTSPKGKEGQGKNLLTS